MCRYCTGKTGLDTGWGFCENPASFPGTPFFSRILPCSEPFAILAGSSGSPALVGLRRCSFAWVLRAVRDGIFAAKVGRTIRCRPAFARRGRRQKNPSSGVSAIKPGKSRPIAARNRRLTTTDRDVFPSSPSSQRCPRPRRHADAAVKLMLLHF